jgi:hypothetical protein
MLGRSELRHKSNKHTTYCRSLWLILIVQKRSETSEWETNKCTFTSHTIYRIEVLFSVCVCVCLTWHKFENCRLWNFNNSHMWVSDYRMCVCTNKIYFSYTSTFWIERVESTWHREFIRYVWSVPLSTVFVITSTRVVIF